MGSCTMHAAASCGARVLLLERFDLLHHLGSSHSESSTIRDAYLKSQYPPMGRLARRLWAEAEAEAGYTVLTPALQLSMVPRSNASLLAAIRSTGAEEADLKRRWGGAFRVPDSGDWWVTVVRERRGGVLNATKAVAMFQALASKKGVVVRDKTEVVSVRKGPEEERGGGEGIVVMTSSGAEFRGLKCVMTVGAWASKLVRSIAGVELPVQPLHTMVLYWRVKPGRERDLAAESGFPTFSSYDNPHLYDTPSLELPGLIKINYDGGPPCDPDARDWAHGCSDVAERAVTQWIDEFLPV